jgi:tetratricopeptide (TPR) repeat protein
MASLPTPRHHFGFILLISGVAALGGFLFGYDSGCINGTVTALQKAFNSSSLGSGFNVASMLLGCAAGAFLAGSLADRFGRRATLIGAALLFGDPDDLIRQLDRLVAEPELRQSIASTAHALVGRERQLAQHAPERLAVYRELAESTTPAEGTAGPLLQQAAERPLTALPGLQQLAPAHWRLGVASPADQQRLLGVDALQRGALAVAAEALAEAARLDPSDPHAHSFLGHALQRQGRPLDALAAFEQAASLDPLQSRPVRALARLHARAARHYAERAATLNPIDDLPQEPEGVERP